MYIKTKKSDWLKCLKIYYSLYTIKSKENHLIERLKSDYRSELPSYKANERIQKEKIIFKTFALYFQEQNRVFEQIGRTIIDMTKATIFEANIDDDL